MMFKKQPKIEFYNVIPGVADIMPIVPASNVIHSWKRTAAVEFNDNKPKCPFRFLGSVSKCPAINSIQSTGWVIKLHQDITIDCDQTGERISWQTSRNNNKDSVSLHEQDKYEVYRSNWPVCTAKQVIKFHMGWYANIPKGYKLLQIPVALSDENSFTAVEGLYDYDLGPVALNIPVYWHNLGKQTTLPAGTVIAQFILVKDDKFQLSVGTATEKQINQLDVNDVMLSKTFVRNYNMIKKYWRENLWK